MKSKGVNVAPRICSASNSPCLRTSYIAALLSSILVFNSSTVIPLIVSYSLEAVFQASNPPSKTPKVLSNPTLESLVTVSSSPFWRY